PDRDDGQPEITDVKGVLRAFARGVRRTSRGVTDAGLKELVAFTQLRVLDLTLCFNITDAGLKELAACKDLQTLHLSGCSITSAGLKELAPCKKLQALHL